MRRFDVFGGGFAAYADNLEGARRIGGDKALHVGEEFPRAGEERRGEGLVRVGGTNLEALRAFAAGPGADPGRDVEPGEDFAADGEQRVVVVGTGGLPATDGPGLQAAQGVGAVESQFGGCAVQVAVEVGGGRLDDGVHGVSSGRWSGKGKGVDHTGRARKEPNRCARCGSGVSPMVCRAARR